MMKTYKSFLLFVVLAIIPLLTVQAQQKYALVIGNGAYTSIARLNNPVNDANDMTAALESLGFQVDKILNGNLDQMENAVVRLKNRLSASTGSYGFFFYAGHGVQSNGENYLIPVDANIASESFLRTKAMQMQAVLDELNQAANSLNIVVLDACRDNPFSWARGGTRGLQVVGRQPADSIIVYATSSGSVAQDGTGRNGLFTEQLLRNLKTPGLEVTEMFRRTGADVSRVSDRKQIPAIYNQFFGTVYLNGTSAPVVTPGPVTAPAPTVQSAAPPQQSAQSANMVRINGGRFTMGSPSSEANRQSNEVQHQVTVSSFYIGKYEVTQREYQAVMGTNPSGFKGDNLPVEQVTWFDAIEYCIKRSRSEGLTPAYTMTGRTPAAGYPITAATVSWNRNANGYRLPTEAEWEYACRAGTTTAFNSGNNAESLAGKANVADLTAKEVNPDWTIVNIRDGYVNTAPVGSFAPNTWGLYDMHGNVWEWCWDWYGNYSSGSQTDPAGASSGTFRVWRGGSWFNYGQGLRSAFRNYFTPSYRRDYLGFRVCRPSL
ncbi:hypothetical protein FACS1894151_03870 [Spirochaetia bacterium]|nr:hypothetical protein FACS1894151_03870 [Spirochaetia bacterium]